MVTRSIRASTTALNDTQIAMLQAMLEEQRRFRIEQLAAAAEPHQAQPVRTEADLEVQETILRGARLALTDVESALARISHGSYGRCAHCGTTMPLERLEVLPQAALCMPCQRSADAVR